MANFKTERQKLQNRSRSIVQGISDKLKRFQNAGYTDKTIKTLEAEIAKFKGVRGKNNTTVKEHIRHLERLRDELGTMKTQEKRLSDEFKQSGFEAIDKAYSGPQKLEIMRNYYQAIGRLQDIMKAERIEMKGINDSEFFRKEYIEALIKQDQLNFDQILNASQDDMDELALSIGEIAGLTIAMKLSDNFLNTVKNSKFLKVTTS